MLTSVAQLQTICASATSLQCCIVLFTVWRDGTQNTAYCVTSQVAFAIKQNASFFMVIAVPSLWSRRAEPLCIYRFAIDGAQPLGPAQTVFVDAQCHRRRSSIMNAIHNGCIMTGGPTSPTDETSQFDRTVPRLRHPRCITCSRYRQINVPSTLNY